MSRSTAGGLLAAPHLVVGLLVLANVAAYLLCLRAGGTLAIPAPVLAAAGALTPAALGPGERWRLVAAGFLHADPTHLLVNLLSLLVAGPVLERRLGGPTFALVYAAALAGAGVTSVSMHAAPFVGVGASGAIFGIMGALVALWALGAEDLSARFFLVNFGLNAAAGARDPRVDWAAHVGGFATGMAVVATLDVASRVNRHWLRCKFPDFVTADAVVLLATGGVALWGRPPFAVAGLDPRPLAACCIAAGALGAVKLLDLLLSLRRGLAATVLVLAGGNAAAAWGACEACCRRWTGHVGRRRLRHAGRARRPAVPRSRAGARGGGRPRAGVDAARPVGTAAAGPGRRRLRRRHPHGRPPPRARPRAPHPRVRRNCRVGSGGDARLAA